MSAIGSGTTFVLAQSSQQVHPPTGQRGGRGPLNPALPIQTMLATWGLIQEGQKSQNNAAKIQTTISQVQERLKSHPPGTVAQLSPNIVNGNISSITVTYHPNSASAAADAAPGTRDRPKFEALGTNTQPSFFVTLSNLCPANLPWQRTITGNH